MNPSLFNKLYAFHRANQLHRNHTFNNKQGRRTVKGKAKHVGVVLKHSTIKPDVGINRIFSVRRIGD